VAVRRAARRLWLAGLRPCRGGRKLREGGRREAEGGSLLGGDVEGEEEIREREREAGDK
jgi:hypothetical protein